MDLHAFVASYGAMVNQVLVAAFHFASTTPENHSCADRCRCAVTIVYYSMCYCFLINLNLYLLMLLREFVPVIRMMVHRLMCLSQERWLGRQIESTPWRKSITHAGRIGLSLYLVQFEFIFGWKFLSALFWWSL